MHDYFDVRVINVHKDISESSVRSLFGQAGPVKSMRSIPSQKDNQIFFVSYGSLLHAEDAISKLDNYMWNGLRLGVQLSHQTLKKTKAANEKVREYLSNEFKVENTTQKVETDKSSFHSQENSSPQKATRFYQRIKQSRQFKLKDYDWPMQEIVYVLISNYDAEKNVLRLLPAENETTEEALQTALESVVSTTLTDISEENWCEGNTYLLKVYNKKTPYVRVQLTKNHNNQQWCGIMVDDDGVIPINPNSDHLYFLPDGVLRTMCKMTSACISDDPAQPFDEDFMKYLEKNDGNIADINGRTKARFLSKIEGQDVFIVQILDLQGRRLIFKNTRMGSGDNKTSVSLSQTHVSSSNQDSGIIKCNGSSFPQNTPPLNGFTSTSTPKVLYPSSCTSSGPTHTQIPHLVIPPANAEDHYDSNKYSIIPSAEVTFIKSPHEFYVSSLSEEIATPFLSMVSNINSSLSKSESHFSWQDIRCLREGDAILACFSSSWYRATIRKVTHLSSGIAISVFYNDYGNEEELQMNENNFDIQIRRLPSESWALRPSNALKCSLRGSMLLPRTGNFLVWQQECKQLIEGYVNGSEVRIIMNAKDGATDSWFVDVLAMDQGKTLCKILIENNVWQLLRDDSESLPKPVANGNMTPKVEKTDSNTRNHVKQSSSPMFPESKVKYENGGSRSNTSSNSGNRTVNKDLRGILNNSGRTNSFLSTPVSPPILELQDDDLVTFSHLVSPTEFYVNRQLDSRDINCVENCLSSCFAPNVVSSPAVGEWYMTVDGNKSDYNSFVRCRVLEKKGEMIRVNLIDTGSVIEVQRVFVLPDEMKKFPAFALRCSFGKTYSNNLQMKETFLAKAPQIPCALSVTIIEKEYSASSFGGTIYVIELHRDDAEVEVSLPRDILKMISTPSCSSMRSNQPPQILQQKNASRSQEERIAILESQVEKLTQEMLELKRLQRK